NKNECHCPGRAEGLPFIIKHEEIIKYLKTLPESEHHCAELSVGAFYLALKKAAKPFKIKSLAAGF
ncbi:MAG: hypothetical protein KAI40_12395, partial [Desulfobacterales bacterium]|nr:hypothetical protein [Desulfobacterales bacterium]